MTAPGIWGCQCTSLISFCPWWTKRSWGGTSFPPPKVSSIPKSSESCSTAKSQSVTWSSAPDAAKIESSVGCHSIEVMGCLCQVKWATGAGSEPPELENRVNFEHYAQISHTPVFLDVSKIPGFDFSFVTATHEEIACQAIPADDIHVAIMCIHNASNALTTFWTYIPDLDALIHRTRSKNSWFWRAPLNILHARRVWLEWLRKGIKPGRWGGCEIDFGMNIAS